MNINPCDTCSLCVSLVRENGDFPYNQCMAYLRTVTRNNVAMDNGGENYSPCELKVEGKPWNGYIQHQSISESGLPSPDGCQTVTKDEIVLRGETTNLGYSLRYQPDITNSPNLVVGLLAEVFTSQEIRGINLDATVNAVWGKIKDSHLPDNVKEDWKTKLISYLKAEKERNVAETVLHSHSDSPMAIAMRKAMQK